MKISERIFQIMEEKEMQQLELSKRTGIAQSTIADWKRFKTNPSADKIMIICDALNVSPEDILFDTMTSKQKAIYAVEKVQTGKITINQGRKLLGLEEIR